MVNPEQVRLQNAAGMSVTLFNYGARIGSIKVPVNGGLTEVTVVPDETNQLLEDPFYLGATCGPVCNRIAGARFAINDQEYRLSKNDGQNCLHGGDVNIAKQYWHISEQSSARVVFTLSLEDRADGFPGNREFKAIYMLGEDSSLTIELLASTDKTTPINMTNHAYFNLGEASIWDLQFKLQAKTFLERDCNGLPTGKILPTQLTGYELALATNVRAFIEDNHYPQMRNEGGIDHCFVLSEHQSQEPVAELISEKNRLKLSVFSDKPCIQFYTGRFLCGPFRASQGLCFESQGYTDAVNRTEFPSVLVAPESQYSHTIVYQFDEVV